MTAVPLPHTVRPARSNRHAPSRPDAVAPGAGVLRFTRVRGATALTCARASSPLRFLHPRNSGSAAWVYSATYGGGLLGGDAIDVDVTVEPGASALLSTQASTKVYRADAPASQCVRARVADDGLLVLFPDPVTPFSGAHYSQEQRLELTGGANLIAVDWMTAGRLSAGERWQFRSYESRAWLRREGRTILHEALRLSPEDGDVAARLGRFNCLAWAIVIGPAVRSAALRLAGALATAPVPPRADVLWSAAPIGDDGLLLRIAGVSAQQVGALLKQQLSFLPSLLGDDPWTGKW